MDAPTETRTRSFARVEENLPVRLRVVGPHEAAELAHRFCITPTGAEQLASDAPAWERAGFGLILARIERLERTLARIARALSLEDEPQARWILGQTINLSGGGLAVKVGERIPETTLIEIDLTLPGEPTVGVRALGRVVSVIAPDGSGGGPTPHQLGIAFQAIHDADREAVVRYTFRLQRQQLRDRRSDPR